MFGDVRFAEMPGFMVAQIGKYEMQKNKNRTSAKREKKEKKASMEFSGTIVDSILAAFGNKVSFRLDECGIEKKIF